MFKFKKIASILASTLMIGSTVGFAAAASTYPSPFTAGGVAIIYPGNVAAAQSDLVAAMNIMDNLNTYVVGATTTGTTATVTGEAYPLFTSGTKLYVNDTLNTVRTTLTKTELPKVLAKGTFSGNVEATYEQTIDLGNNPSITFAKQPTSSDNPEFGLTLSTTSGNIIYNATVTFSKAVNFTHADSKGADLTLFGQKFTIASSTDASNLVLLKTAEKISLTSEDPSAEVTIAGKKYTIDLVSASTTDATIKVTDENGGSDTKSVNENSAKKIQGITIAVTTADSNNLKYIASIIAGAEKVTLSSTAGSNVKYGEEDKTLDGTTVTIAGQTTAATKMTFGVFAKDSDNDAILPGKSYVDPIFGTMKLDFTGLNIASDDATKREDIKINPNGDDKIDVNFMAGYASEAKSITWAKNLSSGINLQYDDDSHNITVMEMGQTFRQGYLVAGNEESGRLVKVSTISNDSSTASSDNIVFTDIFTGETITTASPSTEGTTTVIIGGKSYAVTYGGTGSADTNWVRLNYPDSTSSTGDAVIYPTIKTSKGAKLAFYKPMTIPIMNWDGASHGLTGNSGLRFPDGDGYTDATFAWAGGYDNWTISGAGSGTFNSSLTTSSVKLTIGKISYNVTGVSGSVNSTKVYLNSPQDGSYITDPALVIFEEKDDNSEYQALVVTLDSGASSSNALDVSDVIRTWGGDLVNDQISMPGNSNIAKEADLWGTIITRDSGSSGHTKATISYPDEQIYANIYMGEESAAITGGTSGGTGGGTTVGVPILDSEASSASTKNWIVVGGSCVNSIAAQLIGATYPACGADWTAKTSVGADEYLIQTFEQGTAGKVATLVAGYNAGDTTNAATYLRTQTGVDTTVGKKYKGTTSTSATLQTTATSSGNSTA